MGIQESEPNDMSESLMDALEIEHPAELYSDEVKQIWDNALAGETIEKKDLAQSIFAECKLQAERAKECGKKNCRYSKPLLQLCIQIRAKLGSGRYEFLSKCTSMPSDKTCAHLRQCVCQWWHSLQ